HNGNLIATALLGSAHCGGQPFHGSPLVVRLEGGDWHAIGAPPNGSISGLASFGDELIAYGAFYGAGGVPSTDIVRWNGTSWQTLGFRIEAPVSALYATPAGVLVGATTGPAGDKMNTLGEHVFNWTRTSMQPVGPVLGLNDCFSGPSV